MWVAARVLCSSKHGGSLVYGDDLTETRYIPFSHKGKPYAGYERYDVMASGNHDATAAIFTSLFSNAIKYAKSKAGLDIEQEDGFVVCSVSNDVDVQIPPEYRETIFNHVRVPGTGRQGTGLGLASARRLAELQGGRLWLETEADQVTFRFTIPAANK